MKEGDGRSSVSFDNNKSNNKSSQRSRSRTSRSRAALGSSSSSSSSSLSVNGGCSSRFLVCVGESRAGGGGGGGKEMGVAALDEGSGDCFLYQFADSLSHTKLLHKIHLLAPLEVLLPHTSCAGPVKSPLYRLLEEALEHTQTNLVTVDRADYNDMQGLDYIRTFGLDDVASIYPGLMKKYYCLAAVCALMRYLENVESVTFSPKTLRFKYCVLDDSMMIDAVTAKNLELTVNILNPMNGPTLFSVLNQTQTPMGGRLLRMNILQPLVDEAVIKVRLDAVEHLMTDEIAFFAIRDTLKSFKDVDHLISSLIQVPKKPNIKFAEQSINNVITLKYTVKLVEPLRAAVQSCIDKVNGTTAGRGGARRGNRTNNQQHFEDDGETVKGGGEDDGDTSSSANAHAALDSRCSFLDAIVTILSDPDIEWIDDRIDQVINEDVTLQKNPLGLRNQRCYAVKSGFNGLLDVARQTYKEATNDTYDHVTALNEKYSLNIKVVFSTSNGFQLSIPVDQTPADEPLPSEFLNVVKRGKSYSFTTLKVLGFNDRIQESLTEVYLMSDKTISELVDDVRTRIKCLYSLSEAVALLDMLMSFANTCTLTPNYVRPEFTETLAVRSCRHPIKEKLPSGNSGFSSSTSNLFVPNDIYCSEETSCCIITGPNMSGKSTFLRQIALVQVMAQIGSFVPAEYASFRITDSLFSRLGTDDNLEANASTFMVEMREVAYILSNVTNASLVIMDELGRGTSHCDGVGMAVAVVEELLTTRAFVFFATHFKELCGVVSSYPNVVNLHLDVAVTDEKIPLKDNSDSIHSTGDHQHRRQIAVKYLYTVKEGVSSEQQYGLRLAAVAGFPEDILQRAEEISNQMNDRVRELKKDQAELLQQMKNEAELVKLVEKLKHVRASSSLDPESLMAYMLDLQQLYFGRDGSEYGGSLKSMDESDTMEENNVFDGDTAERVGKGDGHEENDAMDL